MRNSKYRYHLIGLVCLSLLVLFSYLSFIEGDRSSWPRLKWEKGDLLAYTYQSDIKTYLQKSPLISDNKRSHTKLEGVLVMKVLATEPDVIEAVAQLTKARQFVDREETRAQARLYETPVLLSFSRRGEVQKVTFTDRISEQNAQELRSFYYGLQVTFNEDGAPDWNVIDKDPIGAVVAEYVVVPDGQGIKRTLSAYDSIRTFDSGDSAKGKILAASLYAVPSRSASWLKSLRSSTEAEVSSGEIRVHYSFSMSLKKRTRVPDVQIASLLSADDFRSRYLSYQPQIEVAQSALSSEARGRVDIDALVKKVPERPGAKVTWSLELAKTLRDNPDALPEVENHFIEATRSDDVDTIGAILHALHSTDTPEAQISLVNLINNDQIPRHYRESALMTAGQLEHPTEEVLQSLEDNSVSPDKDFASVALLNYGAALDSYLGVNMLSATERVQRLGDRVHEAYQNNDKDQFRTSMLALGNTRHPLLGQVAEPYLDDPDPAVRGQAAKALGRLDDGGSLELLTSSIRDETNTSSRYKMVQGLIERQDKQAMRISQEILFEEPDPTIRKALVVHLGKHKGTYSSNAVILKTLLPRERDPQVKETIRQQLATRSQRQQ